MWIMMDNGYRRFLLRYWRWSLNSRNTDIEGNKSISMVEAFKPRYRWILISNVGIKGILFRRKMWHNSLVSPEMGRLGEWKWLWMPIFHLDLFVMWGNTLDNLTGTCIFYIFDIFHILWNSISYRGFVLKQHASQALLV